MTLPIFFMITTAALATQVLSATVPPPSPPESAEKATDAPSSVETFDSYAVRTLPEQLPLTIQLPREEISVPFYPEEPASYLRAPQFVPNQQPNFYQVPVPSEYLTAPTEGAWNPNNDPTYYYELPPSVTKENVPTNEFPKKFIKDVHFKSKPIATKPKQEIALQPINEAEYLQRQKELYKTVQRLNKKANQKSIEQEQAQQTV